MDVIVLNADLQFLHRVPVQHAVRMLFRQVAEVVEAQPDRLIGVWPMPTVVKLVRYIYARWQHHTPPWSKRGVIARDRGRCGYCPKAARTVDHIRPRSQGGGNTWANTIAACDGCNQRKANRTPREAGMVLLRQPTIPTWGVLAGVR